MSRIILLFTLGYLLILNISFAQQKVLPLPKCCDDSYRRLDVNEELLDDCGPLKNTPWVVYSDRGQDFGQKYYVVEENKTQVMLYTASSIEADKLVNGKEVGLRNKTELLVHYSSELLTDGIIHKKCVVLNKEEILEDIIAGKMSESDIPLYKSPTDLVPMDSVPLYFIYFIYKTEKGRYLIGSDFKFLSDKPFSNQIFGWVDTNRVYLYDTRICFEPNWEPTAIKERRCKPDLAAKVFVYSQDAEKGKLTGELQWAEPQHFYLYSSDLVSDSAALKSRITKLCEAPDAEAENFMEEEYLPGEKFRFPLINVESDNVFKLGCTGRYEDQSVWAELETCNNLREHKSDLNISIIIDQTLRDTRAGFVLEQINQSYENFTKQYGACYFPRPLLGEKNKPLGNKYSMVREYILNYKPGSNLDPEDNCLKTLNFILMNEDELDIKKTNVIIILNNSPVPQLTEKTRNQIINYIVQKNCYIIAFDYKGNTGMISQLKDIMLQAANKFAASYSTKSTPPYFAEGKNYEYLENSGVLAMLAMSATSNPAEQVKPFLKEAHDRIEATIEKAINDICNNVGKSRRNEDPYQKTLREIAQSDVVVPQRVRALLPGYSTIMLPAPGATKPMWKAEVLMTEGELENLISLLNKFTTVGENVSEQSDKIYELWKSLANRFVGDQLNEEEILDLTPQQVLNKIVRSSFGYTNENIVLKNFTLRQIKNKDPDAIDYFREYKNYVIRCYNNLAQILNEKSLEFINSRDENSTISYYWVPIDKLP